MLSALAQVVAILLIVVAGVAAVLLAFPGSVEDANPE